MPLLCTSFAVFTLKTSEVKVKMTHQKFELINVKTVNIRQENSQVYFGLVNFNSTKRLVNFNLLVDLT